MIYWADEPRNIQRVADLLIDLDIVKRNRGQRKKKGTNDREILDIVTAFDIQTTTITLPPEPGRKHNEHGFMYVWQWRFGEQFTLMGRTWEQFTQVCETIKSVLQYHQDRPLFIVYVHNLSFEFQYFTGIYDFSPDQVFAVKARKILYCRMYNFIQFRCSYLQSNMSLAKFAEAMQADIGKASGDEYNYNKIRYPWTPLTETEIEYCQRDVISVVQSITNEMKKEGDNLISIPLTSTGYVRRDCKKAVAQIRRGFIQPQLPTVQVYRLLREAFRGGNCHCNPYYKGKITDNVVSYDMVSCYPAQQLTREFPITPFQKMEAPNMDKVIQSIVKYNRAVLGRYTFGGLKLKSNKTPIPYISLSKCRAIGKYKTRINPKTGKREKYYSPVRCDNGRVLYADLCKMTLTEIDLQIILQQYNYKYISVQDVYTAEKGMLPTEYRRVIKHYYQQKTKLKSAQKADENARYWYGKNKNLLNAVYGMSAQDPVHAKIQYVGRGHENPYSISDYESGADERLQKAPFPYQWGVWTTALARRALQQGIQCAWRDKRNKSKGSRLVYSDTDSIKIDGKIDLSSINRRRIDQALKHGAYAVDDVGEVHYMGVYQVDGVYDNFVSLGAKRYADIEKGHMNITVSGVTKKRNPDTGEYLAVQELGSLQNFREGFIFEKAGGTASLYNDADDFYYTDPQTGNQIHITNNVVILQSTYQLSNDIEYLDLLDEITTFGAWKKERE